MSATVDGTRIALPADARARELLAYLAVHPGAHSRQRLAGLLRPDVAEASARKTLRDAVYELRRAFSPAEPVIATREAVLLRAEVDLLRFRAADRLEDRARLAGYGESRLTRALHDKVDFRGARRELLAGLDADWVLRARDEHHADVAAVLAALTDEAEDVAGAIAWTRRRIEHEPLGEAGHRDLIRLLAAAGDRPAALAAADVLAERLRRELRVPPCVETRALVEQVRRGRVGAVAPTAQPALPAPLARTVRPEGREAPLTRLRATWDEVRSGTLRIAVATGEPGIGKTTLLGELARHAHADGAAILFGRSDEHGLLPYQPWVEALERHLAGLDPIERERRLGDGALARLLPSPAAEPADAAGDRYRAFEAVRGLLEETAAERPVLLVLDDLHWADPDSLLLLRHVVRMAGGARLLVAISMRDAELSAAAALTLADLRREGPLLHIALTGLDQDAVAAVVARHDATGDAAAYRERTGGNPFFLDELLRDEAERGTSAAPPPGVRAVIGRRLSRLPASARRAHEAGAAQGLEFEPLALDDETLDGLADATAAGLVAPVCERRFAFAHALIVDTLLAELPASRLGRLHLEIADALTDGHAAEIARHLRAAGPLAPPERRIRAELAAARQAEAMLAYADAAAHYEAALEVARRSRERVAAAGIRDQVAPRRPGVGGDGAAAQRPAVGGDGAADFAFDRAEVLLALGAAQDRAGCRAAARAAFAAVVGLARARRDPVLLARAALGHGGLGVLVAAPDASVTRPLDEALEQLPAHETALAARLRARLAIERYYPDRASAEALSVRAVQDARASKDPAALAAALNALRVACWTPGRIDDRLAAATEMIEAATAAGDREGALQGRNWRVVDLMELGDRHALEGEIDAYTPLADAVGLPHYGWYDPLWRSALAQLDGRWQDAQRLGERALELAQRAGDQMAPWLVKAQQQSTLDLRGWLHETDRDWFAEQAAASAQPWAWLTYLAYVDAGTGRDDGAREVVAEMLRDGGRNLPDTVNWHVLCDLGEAVALLGDEDSAAILHAKLAPHARLFPVVARGGLCLGSAEYFVGRLASTLGRHDEAEWRLRRAVGENLRIGARPRATIALMRLGELLADRGDEENGRATLLEAAAQAGALDMPGVAARALAAAARTVLPAPA
ncbi:AAA family ATPase [Solirubrobacter ginsenosidimutans]|uniref:AAA family ATPase n=1 Tax=Solirubrobacter ginsenosidimutans TaxID=490573 RepID=A0A9X3MTE3_9ACTN|nr:AAA family ATPase [Solirubrobacter ginsenosidimutans]